jgi:membrane associated rhomboid family serine protease
MVGVRIRGKEVRIGREQLEIWIREGRIPPTALVDVEGRGWVHAAELPAYGALAPRSVWRRATPSTSVRDALFPRRGVSATELLVTLNVLVSSALWIAWGRAYATNLLHLVDGWWGSVHAQHAYFLWLPTIFLHAGPGHLLGNMTALLAASGAVEFLSGGRWAVAVYLVTGMAGAWVSYAGHGSPPLSVGASGAVFGLLGATVSFLLRNRRTFNYAQQWKVWRVYVPMFVLLFLPALANADIHAHAGGFVSGLLIGLLLPPHPRIARLAAVDPLSDRDEAVP